MNDEEDAHNAELDEQMKACEHAPLWERGKGVRCLKCGGDWQSR